MLSEVEVTKMLVDGSPWANWHGFQLPVSDEYVCIWSPLGTKKHWKPRNWKPDFFYADANTLTYIWPDQWFAIHISYSAEGHFRSGYCDVTLPAPAYTSTSQDVIYTDLYLDVVIRKDFSVYTKDQEVFERASKTFQVVADSYQKSYEVLDWMEEHAKNWSGPFEVMPKQLPYTQWDDLSTAEIRDAMQNACAR